MKKILALIILIIVVISCGKDEPKKGNYYFDFDEVVYYKDKNDVGDNFIVKRGFKVKKDSLLKAILIGISPNTIDDTISLSYLDSIGFSKKIIPQSKNSAIKEVFREKTSNDRSIAACAWIYRDIYVFKKKGKVTGIAKLCYDCGHEYFVGTTANVEGFGKNGEYEAIYKIANK